MKNVRKRTPELRKFFKPDTKFALNWFPGHMRKAFQNLREQHIDRCHVILEIRDARVPLSSINPKVEELIRNKRRIIIFNKSDLAGKNSRNKIRQFTEKRHPGSSILFTDGRSEDSAIMIRRILNKEIPRKFKTTAIIASVLGLPNVGKSTIINSLKTTGSSGGHARTGDEPGVTRHIRSFQISDSPRTIILDTPGVFSPGKLTIETGLNLALSGCVKEGLVDGMFLADYLLFMLNYRRMFKYVGFFGLEQPVDNVEPILFQISRNGQYYIGRTRDVRSPNYEKAGEVFVQLYRSGKFGTLMLDMVNDDGTIAKCVVEGGRNDNIPKSKRSIVNEPRINDETPI
eukprot:982144_1